MQPAEFLVEIDKPGCDADRLAAALERRFGARDSLGQRGLEFAQPALGFARGGEIEQFLLGAFDLQRRRVVEVVAERVGDHVLADRDQLPP